MSLGLCLLPRKLIASAVAAVAATVTIPVAVATMSGEDSLAAEECYTRVMAQLRPIPRQIRWGWIDAPYLQRAPWFYDHPTGDPVTEIGANVGFFIVWSTFMTGQPPEVSLRRWDDDVMAACVNGSWWGRQLL